MTRRSSAWPVSCFLTPESKLKGQPHSGTSWAYSGIQELGGQVKGSHAKLCSARKMCAHSHPKPGVSYRAHSPGVGHTTPGCCSAETLTVRVTVFSDAVGGKDQNKVLIISLLLLSPGCRLWLICRKLGGPVSHPGESLRP